MTQLVKKGIGEQQLIKLTGHSSANSIKSYLQIGGEHQQIRSDERVSSSSLTISENKAKGSGATYNNCTFYFNCQNKN